MVDAPDGPPPTGELGTMLSWSDSLFTDYLDPTLGTVPWWEARDYAAMLRSESQAKKVEQVLTLPILGAPVTIAGAKGDKGEAEAVNEWLTRPANNGGMSTPLRMVLAQATTAITFRVASFEKVWKEDPRAEGAAGRWMLDKLAFRPAINTRVKRDRKNGGYRGLEQDPPYGGALPIKIGPDRAWTYVHGQHRQPVLGSSDMEIPLVCWRAKQKLRFLWFLFLELHAQPRTTFRDTREGAATNQAAESAAKKFARMKAGGAIAMPPGVQGEVLETAGHAADLFQQALKYLDSEMTGQVLAQFADLASAAADGAGSYALSRDQSDLFMQTRRYAADELAESFTGYVIADLVRHNFGPDAAVPALKYGPLAPPALDTLVTALGTFGADRVPDEFVTFLVEATATSLSMPTDKVAALVKSAEENARQRAEARQAGTGDVAGTAAAVTAAENIVRAEARRNPEVADRAQRAATAVR